MTTMIALPGRRMWPAALWLALVSCGGSDGTGPAPVRVAQVEITGNGTVIAAGQTLQLTAVARDSANAVTAAPISWSSSPSAVASVSETGLVRGLSAGSATITAAAGGKAATWNVAVRDTTALPRTLSGRIERVDMSLTGDYSVSADLVLKADRTLRVNGTILVRRGATITLWSDSLLELSGTIAPDTAAPAALRVRHLTSGAAPSFHDGDEELYIGIGGMHVTIRNQNLFGACPFAIAGRPGGSPFLVVENSYVLPAEGAPGTKANPRGGNGCDAELGTARAQQVISQRINAPTVGIGSLRIMDTRIYGGVGGAGYTMQSQDGLNLDNTWKGTAGSGGNGGSVRIAAGTIAILDSDIQPGSGGGGGYLNVTLANASGPNGEGQSLDGVTGSAGGGGDLQLEGHVVEAARLREAIVTAPGGVLLDGGNGGPGANGGELKMVIGSHSARGSITVPAGVTVEPSPANPGTFNTVTINGAANGGHALLPHHWGGNGGSITVVPSDAASNRADVRTITLDNVSSGGNGYNGCIPRPKVDGTHGGTAGALHRRQTPMTQTNSFNGGRGGNGHDDQGIGGAAGRDVDNGAARLGVAGVSGVDCPDLLGISVMPPSFTHTEGQDPCPYRVASPMLTNLSAKTVHYAASVSGTGMLGRPSASGALEPEPDVTMWLNWTNASGTLQPGDVTTITLWYTCAALASFNATLEVVATPADGGPPETIRLQIGALIFRLAVRLNYALGPYPVGSVIPLVRVSNRQVFLAHTPFCTYTHLHPLTAQGITIADASGTGTTGPYPDPEQVGCGYGAVITVQVRTLPALRSRPP